ncbi:hypothetical protein JRQ81_018602 [Phrynocephalus forsythii]|uniref:C2H2-type domain-containing protein n=1 Tax=Phrynocephalus forsythii TaxID=171643 RepID=A0A9Q0XPJ1_9SAUR|nr:hypothetical protein JRQ81_018602 [Phrynocephalus forsythii]
MAEPPQEDPCRGRAERWRALSRTPHLLLPPAPLPLRQVCVRSFQRKQPLLRHLRTHSQKGGCSTGAKEKQRGSPSRQRQQPRGRHRLESARGERLVPPRPLRAKAREKLDPNGTCRESGEASAARTAPPATPKPTQRRGRAPARRRAGGASAKKRAPKAQTRDSARRTPPSSA